MLASSAERASEIRLPTGWLARVEAEEVVIADAYWDEQLGKQLMSIGVPILAPDRSFIGALVTNVTYRPVLTILLVFAPGDSGNLFVIAPDGATIVALGADDRPRDERRLPSATTERLFASWKRWAEADNSKPGSARGLGMKLAKRASELGIVKHRIEGRGRGYAGIQLNQG